MSELFVITASVLMLSACEMSEGVGGNVVAITSASHQVSTFELTQSAEVPQCDVIDYDGAHIDCVLLLNDDHTLFLDFTADAAQDEWGDPVELLEVSVMKPGMGVVQTFTETVGNTFNYPALADVDNDGDLELMIATYTGNVNTTWHVWQQTADDFLFAGEVNGLGLEFNEETGLSVISSRGSAVTYYWDGYRLEENGLVAVYSLMTDLHARTCTLDQGPGFAESGLDADAILAACSADMVGP